MEDDSPSQSVGSQPGDYASAIPTSVFHRAVSFDLGDELRWQALTLNKMMMMMMIIQWNGHWARNGWDFVSTRMEGSRKA